MLEKDYSVKDFSYYGKIRKDVYALLEDKKVNRILDVGCSSGFFAEYLLDTQKCNEAYGIELFPEAAKIAETKLTKVYCDSVENAIDELPEAFFDIIFFNDVLEHLVNPEEVLLKIKSKLTKDGIIITSIPNMMYFMVIYRLIMNQDFKYESSGVMDKTHLRWFTRKSILRMFENCGYDVLLTKGNYDKFAIRKKFKIINFLSGGKINESAYVQWLNIIKPKN